MFTCVTGKLGSGKTQFAASLVEEYARQGRRIVCNFPLDFSNYAFSTPLDCTIIPARPSSKILADLGRGSDREDVPGLLIIDEGSMVLNARTWNDPDRERVIQWLAMSRKLNWNIYVIIQHASALDKQIRELFCEVYVTCMRLDRVKIPVIGLALPRIHVAIGRYGSQPGSPVTERWFYRGTKKLFSLYNTSYIFDLTKHEEPYKVHARVKKDLYYYLNRPISVNLKSIKAENVVLYPAILVASVFVMLVKCIPCPSPNTARKS